MKSDCINYIAAVCRMANAKPGDDIAELNRERADAHAAMLASYGLSRDDAPDVGDDLDLSRESADLAGELDAELRRRMVARLSPGGFAMNIYHDDTCDTCRFADGGVSGKLGFGEACAREYRREVDRFLDDMRASTRLAVDAERVRRLRVRHLARLRRQFGARAVLWPVASAFCRLARNGRGPRFQHYWLYWGLDPDRTACMFDLRQWSSYGDRDLKLLDDMCKVDIMSAEFKAELPGAFEALAFRRAACMAAKDAVYDAVEAAGGPWDPARWDAAITEASRAVSAVLRVRDEAARPPDGGVPAQPAADAPDDARLEQVRRDCSARSRAYLPALKGPAADLAGRLVGAVAGHVARGEVRNRRDAEWHVWQSLESALAE